MRNEFFSRDIIPVGQVAAAALVLRLAVGAEFQLEGIAFFIQLALHVAAQIEVTSVSHPFQFAKIASRQEGKGIFDIGGAPRIMTQLLRRMLAQA